MQGQLDGEALSIVDWPISHWPILNCNVLNYGGKGNIEECWLG